MFTKTQQNFNTFLQSVGISHTYHKMMIKKPKSDLNVIVKTIVESFGFCSYIAFYEYLLIFHFYWHALGKWPNDVTMVEEIQPIIIET